jgi:hypothetical protein
MGTTNPTRGILADAVTCTELMTDRARGVSRGDYYEYDAARLSVISRQDLADKLPDILRKYRTVDEFWAFIKPEYGSYAERQEFVRQAFEPLLEALEARLQASDAESGSEHAPFACTGDEFFSKVVQILMTRGREREVAVFTAGDLSLTHVESEAVLGDVDPWEIRIGLPLPLYEQLNTKQRMAARARVRQSRSVATSR